MPEFIVSITRENSTYTGYRLGEDARRVRNIIAGIRGRYGDTKIITVHRVSGLTDVTDQFAKREA
ncbi:hypothetical protein [Streptomyces sp. NPDC055006]